MRASSSFHCRQKGLRSNATRCVREKRSPEVPSALAMQLFRVLDPEESGEARASRERGAIGAAQEDVPESVDVC